MDDSLKDRYRSHYVPAVDAFVRAVGEVNAAGIPEVHLPLWGDKYDESNNLRIVFVGRDTFCWGDMTDFLKMCAEAARNHSEPIFPRKSREGEFRDYPFRRNGAWAKEGNSVFWDTVMRLLAAFHSIPDWKQIKASEPAHEILNTFVWANVNSVEVWENKKLGSWEKHARGQKADHSSHKRLKLAAEQHLDSFSTIHEIFRPHVAIIMSRNTPPNYWEVVPQWIQIGSGVEYAFVNNKHGGTHLFHLDHPSRFKWLKVRADDVVKTIVSKWRAVSEPSVVGSG